MFKRIRHACRVRLAARWLKREKIVFGGREMSLADLVLASRLESWPEGSVMDKLSQEPVSEDVLRALTPPPPEPKVRG